MATSINRIIAFISKPYQDPIRVYLQEKKVNYDIKKLSNSALLQLKQDLKCTISEISRKYRIPSKNCQKVINIVARELLKRHLEKAKLPDGKILTLNASLTMDHKEVQQFILGLTKKDLHLRPLELVRKYGIGIYNYQEIKNSIKAIPNAKQRIHAERNFIKLQLIMAGHEFGMGGKIRIKTSILNFFHKFAKKLGIKIRENSKEIKLEGYSPALSHLKLTCSLIEQFEKEPLKSEIDQKTKDLLIESYIKSFSPRKYRDCIDDWKAGKPVIMPTGFVRHAIEVILYKDMLIYANRGGRIPACKIFKISKPENLTKGFIIRLYQCHFDPKRISLDYLEGPHGMKQEVGLTMQHYMPKARQPAGNCAWSNPKAALHALLTIVAPTPKIGNRWFQFWNVGHKEQEFAFIAEYIRAKNKHGDIFTPADEWKLWGEVFNKFFSNTSRNRYAQVMKEKTPIFHLDFLTQTMRSRTYKIADMMQTCAHPDFSKHLLSDKVPGACTLIKSKNKIEFSYKSVSGKQHSHEIIHTKKGYYLQMNSHQIRVKTLHDLQSALKDDLQDKDPQVPTYPLYPVWSEVTKRRLGRSRHL